MSIVIGETLLALSNVSMNYVNGTEKQVKENAKFSDQLGTTEVNNIVKYSLQGTTQGRYLTGGVPPVRFSM